MNETEMIEEDLIGSNLVKLELIYQREEIEQYIINCENLDLQFLISSLKNANWESSLAKLGNEKQFAMLLDLIREI
jgi:hypothetical protein